MAQGEHQMGPAEVRGLLDELQRRLEAANVAAQIHVVGGSAMALLFPNDSKIRITRDIDAAFQPRDEVRDVIAAMAADLGLSPTWLNANSAPFIPPRPSPSREEPGGVSLTVATVEELIAMKLAASREQDLHDLGILADNAGISDPEQLVDIAFNAYGEDSMVLTESRQDYLIMAGEALTRSHKRGRWRAR